MRRKLPSTARKAEATQRRTILPFFQQLTRRVLIRTPEYGLSMMLVLARHRHNEAGSSRRLIVNVSSRPSSKLAAAPGWMNLKPGCLLFETRYPLFVGQLIGCLHHRLYLIGQLIRELIADVFHLVVATALHWVLRTKNLSDGRS